MAAEVWPLELWHRADQEARRDHDKVTKSHVLARFLAVLLIATVQPANFSDEVKSHMEWKESIPESVGPGGKSQFTFRHPWA